MKAVWGHFGPCCFGIVKNNPKIHLRNAPPLALKARQNQIKNNPKTEKICQNPNPHRCKGKPQPKILPKSTFKTLSPVALQPQPLARLAKQGAPLAELYEMTMFWRTWPARRRPCADRGSFPKLSKFLLKTIYVIYQPVRIKKASLELRQNRSTSVTFGPFPFAGWMITTFQH